MTILLIEHDPHEAARTRAALAAAGATEVRVRHATRLADGLEQLRAEPAELVLLNLGLPDGNGLDAFQALQAQAPAVPIVVFGRPDDEPLALKVVRAGAQDFLPTGQTDGATLLRAVRLSIERKRSEVMLGLEASRLAEIVETQQAIAAAVPDLDTVLGVAAERGRSLAGAQAAAIGFVSGGDIEYRAATGHAVGHPRLRVPMDGSLAGLCARTGRVERSDDTETDGRVDREVCRRINARSMLAIPLRNGGGGDTAGVLTVFSPRPAAFDDRDVQGLQLLAGFIATAMARAQEHRARQSLVADLNERVKELTALHEAAQILQNRDAGVQPVLQQIAQLLPRAMRRPSRAVARVVWGAAEATTDGFRRTPWSLSTEFNAAGKHGRIEVAYLRPPESVSAAAPQPRGTDGPPPDAFLPDERRLVESVAEMLHVHLDRQEAEQQLHVLNAELTTSQQRLRMAQEAAGVGTFEWDVRTNVIIWGPEIQALYGFPPHGIGGSYRAWASRVHPDDLPEAERRVRQALDTGVFESEWRTVWPDGTVRWVAARGQVHRDAAGRPLRMLGVNIDVTDRKRAEAALAESERFARATVDALTAEVAILDAAGTVLATNRAWQQFARDNGLNMPGHGVGRNYLAVCDAAADGPDAEARAAAAGIRAVLRAERDEFYLEYPCHSPAEQRWFAMRVTRFAGPGPVRVVVAHENITARVRADALERERSSLRDAVTAMDRVLGVVGHELRTPLAGLRAISEFLLTDGGRDAEQAARFLEDMGREVDRMSDTVDDLLEAARLNSGRARWNWTEFTPDDCCRQALETIRPLTDPARVRLTHDADRPGAPMRGDADAVRRLVLNLLSNARKHTADGQIHVGVRHFEDGGDGWIEITVSDTGAGIPPEILGRLGQAFALNAGVVGGDHVKGTGLGLAICKGIVAAHGGGMTVRSAPGRGTSVTVRLRTDLDGPATAAAAAAEEPAHVLQVNSD